MIEAIKAGDGDRVARLLSEEPALASARNPQGESAVMMAAYRGHAGILDLLVAAKPETDIFEASAIGQTERVRSLAAADPAGINSFSRDGFTPLGLASFFGRREVAEFLVTHGAQVNAASRNDFNVMPIHSAAAGRHTAIVELLLLHSADPNARQRSGFTPLHSAAHNGQADMVEVLLNAGADIHARSEEGLTPLRLARDRGHNSMAELLTGRGARE